MLSKRRDGRNTWGTAASRRKKLAGVSGRGEAVILILILLMSLLATCHLLWVRCFTAAARTRLKLSSAPSGRRGFPMSHSAESDELLLIQRGQLGGVHDSAPEHWPLPHGQGTADRKRRPFTA